MNTVGEKKARICSCRVETPYQAADTITVNLDGSSVTCALWEANEFSGLATSGWFDKGAFNASTGATLDSGTTATLAQADSLAVCTFLEGTGANGTWTPEAGWTSLGAQATTTPVRGLLAGYKVLAATTAEQAGGTHPNTSFNGCIAIYKAAVAGGTGTTRFYLNSTTAPSISPAHSSEWNVTGGAIYRTCSTTKANSSMLFLAGASSGVSGDDRLLVHYVSTETLEAQTIPATTLKGMIRTEESDAARTPTPPW